MADPKTNKDINIEDNAAVSPREEVVIENPTQELKVDLKPEITETPEVGGGTDSAPISGGSGQAVAPAGSEEPTGGSAQEPEPAPQSPAPGGTGEEAPADGSTSEEPAPDGEQEEAEEAPEEDDSDDDKPDHDKKEKEKKEEQEEEPAEEKPTEEPAEEGAEGEPEAETPEGAEAPEAAPEAAGETAGEAAPEAAGEIGAGEAGGLEAGAGGAEATGAGAEGLAAGAGAEAGAAATGAGAGAAGTAGATATAGGGALVAGGAGAAGAAAGAGATAAAGAGGAAAGGGAVAVGWPVILIAIGIILLIILIIWIVSLFGPKTSVNPNDPDTKAQIAQIEGYVNTGQLKFFQINDLQKIKEGKIGNSTLQMIDFLAGAHETILINYNGEEKNTDTNGKVIAGVNLPFEMDVSYVDKIKCTDTTNNSKSVEFPIFLTSAYNWDQNKVPGDNIKCAGGYYPGIDAKKSGPYAEQFGPGEFSLSQIGTAGQMAAQEKLAEITAEALDAAQLIADGKKELAGEAKGKDADMKPATIKLDGTYADQNIKGGASGGILTVLKAKIDEMYGATQTKGGDGVQGVAGLPFGFHISFL